MPAEAPWIGNTPLGGFAPWRETVFLRRANVLDHILRSDARSGCAARRRGQPCRPARTAAAAARTRGQHNRAGPSFAPHRLGPPRDSAEHGQHRPNVRSPGRQTVAGSATGISHRPTTTSSGGPGLLAIPTVGGHRRLGESDTALARFVAVVLHQDRRLPVHRGHVSTRRCAGLWQRDARFAALAAGRRRRATLANPDAARSAQPELGQQRRGDRVRGSPPNRDFRMTHPPFDRRVRQADAPRLPGAWNLVERRFLKIVPGWRASAIRRRNANTSPPAESSHTGRGRAIRAGEHVRPDVLNQPARGPAQGTARGAAQRVEPRRV